jgi:hypothetical protein
MSVTQINKANCRVLREDINKALADILSKHGLVGSIGRITFDPGVEIRTKLTITQPVDGAMKDTQKPAVGQTWVFGGKRYTISSTIGDVLASREVRGLSRTYRIPPKMLAVGTRVK